jgi:hypothetical protein
MITHDESGSFVSSELSLQRIDQPQEAATMQAEAALQWIGNDGSAMMPEKAATTAPAVIAAPVTPATKAGEAATGKTVYQTPPSVVPSGNDATAA